MLMILLKILLWLFLVLAALILLVLVAPIGYQAAGHYGEDFKKGSGQLSLFWGLIRLKAFTSDFRRWQTTLIVAGFSKPISIGPPQKPAAAKASHQPKDQGDSFGRSSPPLKAGKSRASQDKKGSGQPPGKKKPALSFSEALDHLRQALTRELMSAIKRFLQKIWKALRPQLFHIKVVYGLPDPYETAVINNFLMALFAVWPHQTLQLHPVFHDSLVEITGNLKGSLVPGAFLAAALQLLFAKPVRRIWWPLVKQHRKKATPKTSEAAAASPGASSS